MTSRLPTPISGRLAGTANTVYTRQGREFDVAVAGIPFRLAVTPDLPYSIETIPVRKDQVDTENDPGEQSLNGWWRRSQASWHGGAGDLYQENSEQTVDSTTFFESSGVDVFTKGQVSLLKRMEAWTSPPSATTPLRVRTYVDSDTYKASWVQDGNLYHSNIGTGGTLLHDHATETVQDGLVTAANGVLRWYDVTQGSLYMGDAASVLSNWPLGGMIPSRIDWGKFRLWVIGQRAIWQPDLTVASGTAQAPIFTHPNEAWNYTCMAECGAGMLFGGHDGQRSSIQLVSLDSGGGLPTLSGAAETAVLPDGELVFEIATIAGQYVGIGTNRGFRVGSISENGRITYGPLLIHPADIVYCGALTTQDRFFVVSIVTPDLTSTVYRVDTGVEADNLVFPYATDIACAGEGFVSSLAASRTRLLAATTALASGELWAQSETDYVDSGYLETGRIRFRTTEPKVFRSLALDIAPLVGAISVSAATEGGGVLPLGNITNPGTVFSDTLSVSGEKMKYVAFRFTLTPSADLAESPTLYSYQAQALPAVKPQRLIRLPLLCYDREQGTSGQWYGGEGDCRDRLRALREVEDSGAAVTFQDFREGRDGRSVMIESMRFVQTGVARLGAEGAGGILMLELRTVD